MVDRSLNLPFPEPNHGHDNPRAVDIICAGWVPIKDYKLRGAAECRDVIRIGFVYEDVNARTLKPPQMRGMHSDPYIRKFVVKFRDYPHLVGEELRPCKDEETPSRKNCS